MRISVRCLWPPGSLLRVQRPPLQFITEQSQQWHNTRNLCKTHNDDVKSMPKVIPWSCQYSHRTLKAFWNKFKLSRLILLDQFFYQSAITRRRWRWSGNKKEKKENVIQELQCLSSHKTIPFYPIIKQVHCITLLCMNIGS